MFRIWIDRTGSRIWVVFRFGIFIYTYTLGSHLKNSKKKYSNNAIPEIYIIQNKNLSLGSGSRGPGIRILNTAGHYLLFVLLHSLFKLHLWLDKIFGNHTRLPNTEIPLCTGCSSISVPHLNY